jgi:hypothetical protein
MRNVRTLFNTARGYLRAYWPDEVIFPGKLSDNSTFAKLSNNRPTQADIVGYLRWVDSLPTYKG